MNDAERRNLSLLAAKSDLDLKTDIAGWSKELPEHEALWLLLNSPTLVNRTVMLLTELLDDINAQLEADHIKRGTDTEWRAGAVKFRYKVQMRLRRAEVAAGAANGEWVHNGPADILAAAIRRHRSVLDEPDADPEDQKLWAVLEQVAGAEGKAA